MPLILCNNQSFRKIARHYLPRDFPHSVTDNYLSYTLWNSVGSIFGSANAVLATQSLLFALGLGYGSIPLAGTINWILKDFSGQLIAMYLASRISQGFDAYVKKWRFLSCLYYEGSIFLEAITPIFNSQIAFLCLATVANAGKNICWLSTSASKAHINKYMSKQENLADITAKAVSQAITTNLMGTALGMGISLFIAASNTIHLMPIILTLSSAHMFSVYRSLNYIHDPLINMNRCHALLKEFVEWKMDKNEDLELVLTKPNQMTKNEKLLRWNKFMDDGNLKLKYNVSINERLDECFESNEDIISLMESAENMDINYWILMDGQSKLKVWYKQDASNVDVLESMLTVGYLQFGKQDNLVLADAIRFGKENCNEWFNALEQAEWNVDNLFIELDSNRIEYD